MNLAPNALLILSIVLVAGVAGGMVARRAHLPSVVGYILTGVLLGPWGVGIFDVETVHGLQPVTTFALGLIAVAVGSTLNVPRLRNAFKRLVLLVMMEATVTPILVYVLVRYVAGAEWPMAMLLAALAVSTAPATIVAIVKETHSQGVFVKTLIAAVALNNVACIFLFEIAHTAARVWFDPGSGHTPVDIVIAPLRQLALSTLLGGGVGLALIAATWRTVRTDLLTTASIIAIAFTAGLAEQLGVSTLLSCLVLGVTLANVTPEKEEIGHDVFDNFESAIFAVFFTLAGLEADFSYVVSAGMLSLTAIGARLAGKLLAGHLAMRWAGATDRVRRYLGLALVPQAGLAIGLLLLAGGDPALAEVSEMLLAVGLTTVAFNEIGGSVLTRIALARSGDLGKDRARLIDFIREENIVTKLHADTKESAIEQLVDVLIETNHVTIDRQRLLESVLQREEEFSTCLGNGLAIPHGALEDGTAMLGAMGISEEGLGFETPDGRPVHCMVLLATPPTERNRHLEVLAALAQAVGHDRGIQRQLFNAETPAHAYDVLHAEEAADYNYYLE